MSDNEFKILKKKQAFEKFLEESGDVLVHFNTKVAGVEIPESLQGQVAVTLKFSNRFNTPLEYDKQRILQLLLFEGNYQRCVVSWESIWALSTPEGSEISWKEEIPKEVYLLAAKASLRRFGEKLLGRKEPEKKEPEKIAKEEDTQSSEKKKNQSDGSKQKKSHLKRVK